MDVVGRLAPQKTVLIIQGGGKEKKKTKHQNNPRYRSGRNSSVSVTEMESPAGGGPPKRFRSSPRNPQRCGRFLLVVFLSGCAAPAAKSASSFPREETQWSGRICPKEEEGEGEREEGRLPWQTRSQAPRGAGQGRAGQGRGGSPPWRFSFLHSTSQVHLYKFHRLVVLPRSSTPTGGDQLRVKTQDRPRRRFWSIPTVPSIIPPGSGSCWTWSGKVQTTCDAGHPLDRPW